MATMKDILKLSGFKEDSRLEEAKIKVDSDKVEKKYLNKDKKCRAIISSIVKKLDKMKADRGKNWGHVGSISHVEELLGELDQFLG